MAEKPAILIVDDEEPIQRLLKMRLGRQGYVCDTASNADQAMEKLRQRKFALAVLDVRMPGRPGNELLPDIRAAYPDMGIIMATAIDDINVALQCMRAGAADYLTKPLNLEELVLSVDRSLEMRRLRLENREYQHSLEQKVAEQAARIRTLFVNAITALAIALDAKDKYRAAIRRGYPAWR